MRGARGQGAVEYLAVVGLVVAVLGGAAAPAVGGPDLAGGVVRQLRRALCRVRGGDCEEDRRPCVVASSADTRERSLNLVAVRLRSRAVLLAQRRSDGRVAVTWSRQRAGGLGLGLGDGGHLRIGGRRLGGGVELDADVLAVAGMGTTWVLSPGVAARLVHRLESAGAGSPLGGGAPDLRGLPAPVRVAGDHGLEASLSLRLSRDRGAAELRLTSADVAGAIADRSTGRRTLLVRRRTDLAARLTAGAGGALTGGGGGDEQFALTVDRAGRPLDLAIVAGGDVSATAAVGADAAGALHARLAAGAGRRWERERHLDLTDRGNLAIARAALAQIVSPHPRPGRLVTIGERLGRRLATDGVEDVRVYDVADVAGGFDASAEARGVRVGLSSTRDERRARLVSAVQRGPEGLWRRRTDCVGGL